MDAETLLSGIREMISAHVRMVSTEDPEERGIAGEMYTVNEGVVRAGLHEINTKLDTLREITEALAGRVKHHRHPEWRA